MRRLRAGHKAAAHLAFELIREETAFCKALTVRLACQTLDVSRAGYYAWRERAPSKRSVYDAALKKRIRFFFDRSDGTYGARRIHFDLLDDGHQIGRCRVERLMREMNVQGHQKRLRRRVRQLHDEGLHAMDLVQREWHPTGRDQIWVADITQIPTWENNTYYDLDLLLKPIRDLTPRAVPPPPVDSSEMEDKRVERVFEHTVYFGFNEFELTSEELNKLGEFVNQFTDKDVAKSEVFGYADNTGTDIYNLRLSEERAKGVALFLVKNGITIDQIYMEGKGELDNDNPKARNRRVEIRVVIFE